ncbi:uncharacterized protein LOC131531081 [Onychostoma macrolepis]|uniref:uncharacterized protein LOC131531081 n=1 Tax=Onychostoma macrolepis TaxID=369639 RepID=UPI00272C4CC0|nr:uncharacterized protein LOC131531081 [Onychostoma macrolepis]
MGSSVLSHIFLLMLLFSHSGNTQGSSSPESKIKIGDKVYVKPSVATPRYQWGSVTHKSIGVVKDIQGDTLIVDFPEQKNWKAVISEMELVTGTSTGSSSLESKIKIGDKVYVKPSVVTPRYQWGSVTHKSIGVVKDIQGETLIVDFPEQKNWKAAISEMELVTGTSTGSSSPESKIKIGDKVYVKPSVVTPRYQWGSVTHKSIGVVKDIQGETLIVDFPEQKNWKAVISEMELVTGTSTGSSSPESKIKIGDKVYVKPSVVTPRYQWGSVTHKSIGVVKDIQGETLIVDFPEQKNWKAAISEMELVTGTSTGSSSPESKIKIGDKVHVKPSVVTPRYQWGSVTHKSIGVVKDIQERL